MIMVPPTVEYVLLVCVEFTDPTMTVQPVHIGTLSDCEAVRDYMPAVIYNGEKEVSCSYTSIVTLDKWTTMQEKYEVKP